MRLVIQRVSEAKVVVDNKQVGKCGHGFLILCGIEAGDSEEDIYYAIEKTAYLRIFEDQYGKMNLSILDIKGSVLAISQFTLLGDARHGRRPSFDKAAKPDIAIPLYDLYCRGLSEKGISVEKGIFGADMKVSLINDGPVTVLIDSRRNF